MVKLDRIDQPIFAGNNVSADDNVAVFGSMKTSPSYTMDLPTLLASVDYQKGWQNAVAVGYAPFLEEMNGVQYGFSYQLAYMQQQGVSEWTGTTTYYKGSIVKLNTATGCQLYSSKIDNNTGNLLTDTDSWKLVLDSDHGDVNSAITSTLRALYPVGSVYIGTQSACPLSTLIPGSTWALVSSGKALWTGDGTNGGTSISAGLPNITGTIDASAQEQTGQAFGEIYTPTIDGAFQGIYGLQKATPDVSGGTMLRGFTFDASRSDSIYGNSNTVQPPAYVVNVWKRTA